MGCDPVLTHPGRGCTQGVKRPWPLQDKTSCFQFLGINVRGPEIHKFFYVFLLISKVSITGEGENMFLLLNCLRLSWKGCIFTYKTLDLAPNPGPLHWELRIIATGPLGKSLPSYS